MKKLLLIIGIFAVILGYSQVKRPPIIADSLGVETIWLDTLNVITVNGDTIRGVVLEASGNTRLGTGNDTTYIDSTLAVHGNADLDTLTADHIDADSYDMGIMYLPTNAGYFGKLVDMTVTSVSLDNIIHDYWFGIDGDSLLTIKAYSNGLGGIDNKTVNIKGGLWGAAEGKVGSTYCMYMRNSNLDRIFSVTDLGTMALNGTPNFKIQNSTTSTATGDGTNLTLSGAGFILDNREASYIDIRQQSLSREYIGNPVVLTDNSVVGFADIALGNEKFAGGEVKWTIYIIDASGNMQCCSGTMIYAAVNDGGSYTSNFSTTETQALDDGTITNTFSIVNGTNKITLMVNSNTTLTPVTHIITYNISHTGNTLITGK